MRQMVDAGGALPALYISEMGEMYTRSAFSHRVGAVVKRIDDCINDDWSIVYNRRQIIKLREK